MIQYNMPEAGESIFELNLVPRLSYLQKIAEYSDALKSIHKHEALSEIAFIQEGSNFCTISGKRHKIKKGDLILIGSGVSHNVAESGAKKFSCVVLGIKNLQFKNMPRSQFFSERSSPVLSVYKTAPELESIFTVFEAVTKIDPLKTDINAADFADGLLRSLLLLVRGIIAGGEKDSLNKSYTLGASIKEYMDLHYLEDIALADMAKALHMNSYYLSHACKKYLGVSPIQYIISQRIKEAQSLLINTDMSVTEIAFHCGYNNSNYFQTVFKGIVGMPPNKYRKRWQQ